MRLSIYAAIIALSTRIEQCIAAPSFNPSPPSTSKPDAETVKPQSEEELKYFHEPGFVSHTAR